MGIVYRAHGAAREVTGSKHLFEFDGHRILVDCGVFQGKRLESYEKNMELPFDASTLDDVVLTHAHFDHCGNLPSLIKNGYTGNIWSTPATRDISALVLMDAAYLQRRDLEYLKKKHVEARGWEPLYDQDDVIRTMDQFVTVNYHRPIKLAGGVTAEFFDAGHILGSAMVLLTFPARDGRREIKVLASGDVGRHGLPIIRDPEPFPQADYVICESTYGNRLHEPMDQAAGELAEVVNSTIAKGGKVIIPAFAVERTQELIYHLHLLTDQKKIPELDIFVDSPMAVNATSIFRVHPECYDKETHEAFLKHNKNPFGMAKIHYLVDAWDSKKLNTRTEPCVIIASSGMCEGGRIIHHLKNNITNPANTVLVVGYMGRETLGRRIADRLPQIKIFGTTYPLKARVKILNTFSAHADYADMQRYLSVLNKKQLRGVFLVHGEDDALESLHGKLTDDGFNHVYIPQSGQKFDLE